VADVGGAAGAVVAASVGRLLLATGVAGVGTSLAGVALAAALATDAIGAVADVDAEVDVTAASEAAGAVWTGLAGAAAVPEHAERAASAARAATNLARPAARFRPRSGDP
jgi:hypothetical protein